MSSSRSASTDSSASTPATKSSSQAWFRPELLDAFRRTGGLVLAIMIAAAVFGVLSEGSFFEPQNLLGVLRAMSTYAIIGLGLTVVLVVGEIDLSFGSVYGVVGTTIAVAWMVWGMPLLLAVAIGFALALVIAAVNAFLVCVVRVPSFIATLGTSTLAVGLTLLIGNAERFAPAYPTPGQHVSEGSLSTFTGISNRSLPFDIPMQVVWMLIVAGIFVLVLHRSLYGFRARAVGGNENAARFGGLKIGRTKLLAFLIVSAAAAFAALLDFSFIGSVNPDSGTSLLFPVFAAVIIGGASLNGGRGTVAGALLGALLLAVMNNGLALMAAAPYVQQVFLGLVTIGAVVLDQRTRRSAKSS
ncbi:ABC transporter permease [Micromonospora sp. NPDC049051]|uniref:ABC transporter permease n=1 Tax=unclassified Micromonospora TaxID=2617518 RepID=UPI003715F6CB